MNLGLQSDFSILSVSYNTGGTLSTGDKGTKKVCKGKHLPSKRCRLSHTSLEDLPTASATIMQAGDPHPEVARQYNLVARYQLSSSEEGGFEGTWVRYLWSLHPQ